MKSKILMAVIVWSAIFAAFWLSSRSRIASAVTTTAIDIFFLTLIVGGSAYKLALWFRHRHDPEKREAVAFSTQLYPSKIRKFLMDEQDEKEPRNR